MMTDIKEGIERRRYPRVSRSFTMRVKGKDSQDPRWELPMMRNISLGGCYFHSTIAYQEGQALEIEIQLPILRDPLQCTALVRRVIPQKEGMLAYVGVGVEFVNLEQDFKEQLKEVIKFALARQKNNTK